MGWVLEGIQPSNYRVLIGKARHLCGGGSKYKNKKTFIEPLLLLLFFWMSSLRLTVSLVMKFDSPYKYGTKAFLKKLYYIKKMGVSLYLFT